MKIKRKIFWRIILILAFIIVGSSVSISIFTVHKYRERSRLTYTEYAEFLAQRSERLLMWDDRVGLCRMFVSAVHKTPVIRYVFVLFRGQPYVHSFSGGIPSGLLNLHSKSVLRPESTLFRDQEGHVMHDIAVPVGDMAASLHLGLSRDSLDREVWPVIENIASVAMAALVLSVLFASVTARIITKEVADLTRSLKRSRDELQLRVKERTADLVSLNEQLLGEIAERKKTEEELRKHREHLEELVDERTVQLRETNAELESFAYSVSHDLRAPLRAMHGFAQALVEDYGKNFDEAGMDYARRIVKASRRMERLIDDLLSYSRLGRVDIPITDVNMEELLNDILGDMRDVIAERHAEIAVDRPLAGVKGHQATLAKVITNLLDNSMKFVARDERPIVRIWTETDGNRVRFCVRDNGIGISPEHCDRIFQVFERLHGMDTYPGTGVGLAIVKRGIMRMGGRCGVESFPGRGSTFWIELKRAEGVV